MFPPPTDDIPRSYNSFPRISAPHHRSGWPERRLLSRRIIKPGMVGRWAIVNMILEWASDSPVV